MMPLNVWLTRPTAYEVYMGADRHFELWVEKPCYMHTPRANDMNWPSGLPRQVDAGWEAQSRSISAKPLLKQDPDLRKKVWQQVLLSCAPRGMALEEAFVWADRAEAPADVDLSVEPYWRSLFMDRNWEAKCNTSHKRFLLEIDVRLNTVNRILPSWVGRHDDAAGRRPAWVVSDEIEAARAVEYYHPEEEQMGVPF